MALNMCLFEIQFIDFYSNKQLDYELNISIAWFLSHIEIEREYWI